MTTTVTMHAKIGSILARCCQRQSNTHSHTHTYDRTQCMHLRLRPKTFTKCFSIFFIAYEFHLHLNKHKMTHTHTHMPDGEHTYEASYSCTSKSCLNSSTISFNTLQINGVRNIFVRCALLNDAKVSSFFSARRVGISLHSVLKQTPGSGTTQRVYLHFMCE